MEIWPLSLIVDCYILKKLDTFWTDLNKAKLANVQPISMKLNALCRNMFMLTCVSTKSNCEAELSISERKSLCNNSQNHFEKLFTFRIAT